MLKTVAGSDSHLRVGVSAANQHDILLETSG